MIQGMKPVWLGFNFAKKNNSTVNRICSNDLTKNRVNLEALSKKLNSLTLKFDVQVGEDEKLFGSVTSQMISNELSDKGYTIDKKEINLEDPIKSLGNHKVEINLGYDLDTKIKIKVLASK